jgi:hypothetical protein
MIRRVTSFRIFSKKYAFLTACFIYFSYRLYVATPPLVPPPFSMQTWIEGLHFNASRWIGALGGLDRDVFMSLTEADLKELGVESLVDRKLLMIAKRDLAFFSIMPMDVFSHRTVDRRRIDATVYALLRFPRIAALALYLEDYPTLRAVRKRCIHRLLDHLCDDSSIIIRLQVLGLVIRRSHFMDFAILRG